VELAEAAGASERALADVRLAVSEACTNVVLHAYREADEPGSLGVSATLSDDGLLEVVVADEGMGLTPRHDSPGMGLGMALMAAVATSVELDEEAVATRVRLTFALGAGAAAPGAEQAADEQAQGRPHSSAPADCD
jgi:anti-sigma regulatory factor (Ser/Thr protein kinase)